MKKILIFFIFTFPTSSLFAKCNTDAIVYKRESSFGISIGTKGENSSFNDSTSINVPLSINGGVACLKKKSALKISTEDKNGKDTGTIVISPMKVEFENVPNPKIRQYIFAEKSEHLLGYKFHSMSFICSGEIPLSIEASSDSYLELKMRSTEVKMSNTMVFATGKAAQILNKNKDHSKDNRSFAFFSEKFLGENKEPTCIACVTPNIPSILTENSIKSMSGIERAITSSFTTIGQNIPNGCSQTFEQKMGQYLLENYKNNESLEDFKTSEKWLTKELSIKWHGK